MTVGATATSGRDVLVGLFVLAQVDRLLSAIAHLTDPRAGAVAAMPTHPLPHPWSVGLAVLGVVTGVTAVVFAWGYFARAGWRRVAEMVAVAVALPHALALVFWLAASSAWRADPPLALAYLLTSLPALVLAQRLVAAGRTR